MSRECGVCGRETEAFICWECTQAYKRDLERIPKLVDDLDVTITRRAKFNRPSGNVHGQPETPVPFHEGASDAKWVLHNVLGSWIRIISQSRRVDLTKGA